MGKQKPKKRLAAIEIFTIEKARQLRIQSGMSQVDLSVEMNKSSGFIGDVERMVAKYNLKHINTLSEIFKCSPKDFLPEKPLK